MTQTQINFLTTTSNNPQAFTVPSDWGTNSTTEVVGPGGNGSARQSSSLGGRGGGGGSYSKRNNPVLKPGGTTYYVCPAGGAAVDAYFNPLNLCTQSSTIGGTGWFNVGNAAATAAQTDSQGGSTACKITENATSTNFNNGVASTSWTKPASLSLKHWCAIDLKAATRTWCIVRLEAGGSTAVGVYFDLGNGVIGTTSNGTNWSNTSVTMVSLGSGWYRIFITSTLSASDTNTSMGLEIYGASGDNGINYATTSGTDICYAGRPCAGFGDFEQVYTSTTSSAVYSNLSKCGTNATTAVNGASQSGSQGDTTNQGGNGAANVSGVGGGGGGAAGPNGTGQNAPSGTGGTADGGTVAGATTNNNGNSGTEFDGSHGCGSGAGGRNGSSGNGFTGGAYGGGGSGVGTAAAGTGGVGGQALIVYSYTPFNLVAQPQRPFYHNLVR